MLQTCKKYNHAVQPLDDTNQCNGICTLSGEFVEREGRAKPEGNRLTQKESLPCLPLPSLQQTLDKYILAIRPLIDGNQLTKTEALVKEFGKSGGIGEQLQNKLELRQQNLENWLYDLYLRDRYLNNRTSVVLTTSPSMRFPRYDFRGVEGQVKHAAKLIAGVLDYKIDIDGETLQVEKRGGHQMCMDQCYKILSGCRIPGVQRDQIKNYSNVCRPLQHIVIAKNNNFFKLPVYDSRGRALAIEQLEEQLNKIVEDSTERGVGIGILTSDDRNNWGRAAEILMKDSTNRRSISAIHTSIFLVCLDEATPSPADDKWMSDMTLRALHGGGSTENSCNRWFDKTLQFIVCPDGGVGCVNEHTVAEGICIAALLDHVYAYCKSPPEQPKSTTASLPRPQKLQFHVSTNTRRSIDLACATMDARLTDIQMNCLRFCDFGKNFPKSRNMSPDAFVQVAIQLAYMKMHSSTCSTWESASLRRYRLGRTDTIRSCTNASQAFSVAMLDKGTPAAEKVRLLREALSVHSKYTADAMSGQGIDRHLLGLRLIAREMNMEVPDLFTDPTFQAACHFKLSTSQIPFKAELSAGYGPVVSDGYGVCYNPMEECTLLAISAHFSCPETDAYRFGDILVESLRSMRNLALCERRFE